MEPHKLGRPVGGISDPHEIIDHTSRRILSELIGMLARDTSLNNGRGSEMTVSVIRKMSSQWSAISFTQKLFASWGLGGARENGTLLFLSLKDRASYIRANKGAHRPPPRPHLSCHPLNQ